MKITLYFDGSMTDELCGFGWIVTTDREVILEGSGFVPDNFKHTNIVAEYFGLIDGLSDLQSIEFDHLTIKGDCQFVLYSVREYCQTHKEHLIPLKERAQFLINNLRSCGSRVSYQWIPREDNLAADKLSKGF